VWFSDIFDILPDNHSLCSCQPVFNVVHFISYTYLQFLNSLLYNHP